jgi:hypothetical protein
MVIAVVECISHQAFPAHGIECLSEGEKHDENGYRPCRRSSTAVLHQSSKSKFLPPTERKL